MEQLKDMNTSIAAAKLHVGVAQGNAHAIRVTATHLI